MKKKENPINRSDYAKRRWNLQGIAFDLWIVGTHVAQHSNRYAGFEVDNGCLVLQRADREDVEAMLYSVSYSLDYYGPLSPYEQIVREAVRRLDKVVPVIAKYRARIVGHMWEPSAA